MADFDPDEYLANDATDAAPNASDDTGAPPPFDPDAYLSSGQPDQAAQPQFASHDEDLANAMAQHRQETSSTLGAFTRGAVTGLPGLAGGIAGAELGAGAGTAIAPGVGTIVGGLIGAGIGGYAASKAAQPLVNQVISPEQQQADVQQHPYAQLGGELSTAAIPFGFGNAATKGIQRAAGAVLGGGMEAGQEVASGEDLDPTKIGMSAATFAALPNPRSFTQKLTAPISKVGESMGNAIAGATERYRAGRPDTVGPTAQPDKDAANLANDVPKTGIGVAQEETKAPGTDAQTSLTTGEKGQDTPESVQVGNADQGPGVREGEDKRLMSKARIEQMQAAYKTGEAYLPDEVQGYPQPDITNPEETQPTAGITQGQAAPDVQAALAALKPEETPQQPLTATVNPEDQARTAAPQGTIGEVRNATAGARQTAAPTANEQEFMRLTQPQAAPQRAKGGFDPKVVQAAVAQLQQRGMTKALAQLARMPPEKKAIAARATLQALSHLDANPDSAVGTLGKSYANARIPSQPASAQAGERQVTFRSKAAQQRFQNAYNAVKDSYNKFAPPAGGNEAPAALTARLQGALQNATKANGAVSPLAVFTNSRAAIRQTPEHIWLSQAARYLAGSKTPRQAQRFLADEQLIRSGAANEVGATRRINADIAKRRTPTVEQAELGRRPGVIEAVPAEEVPGKAQPVNPKQPLPPEGEQMQKPLRLTPDKMAVLEEARRQANVASSEKPQYVKDSEARAAKIEAQRQARLTGKQPQGEFGRGVTAGKETERTEEAGNVPEEHEGQRPSLVAMFKQLTGDQSGAVAVPNVLSGIKPSVVSDRYTAKAPTTPQQKLAAVISDDMHRLGQNDVDTKVDTAYNVVPSIDKNLRVGGKNSPQERIYRALESEGTNLPAAEKAKYQAALKPEETALIQNKIKPVLAENDQLHTLLSQYVKDPAQRIAGHIHRLARAGFNPQFSSLNPSADPLASKDRFRGLATSTSAMKERSFAALVNDKTGQRQVVSPNDTGLTIWKKGNPTKIAVPSFDMTPGEKVRFGGNDYTVDTAMAHEIAGNGRFENGKIADYHENGLLSALYDNVQLKAALEHAQWIDNLTKTQEWSRFAQTKAPDPNDPLKADWEQLKEAPMPQLRGWYMAPELRHTIEDFVRPGFQDETFNGLRDLSQAVTKMLFYNPVPHAMNVGAHWFTERGWKWLDPKAYRDLGVTSAQAIKSVFTQDAGSNLQLQRQIRQLGGSTIFGGVTTQNFFTKLAQSLGEDIQRNPSKWDNVAKVIGIDPRDLAEGVYRASSKAMWMANDIFYTQAVLERMQNAQKLNPNLSDKDAMRAAIPKVEQHIPNYRVPAYVIGSGKFGRGFSKFLQDPMTMAFGRYHYGVWNSYAHIIKGLAYGTGEQRTEAVGHLMAAALLAGPVYYGLNKMAQAVTGNEGATVNPRGPLAVPMHLMHIATRGDNLNSLTRGTLTIPPMANTALELYNNADFAGRPIYHSGEEGVKGLGANALAVGEHALRGTVAPYNTAVSALQKKEGVGSVLRDQFLDINNPSEQLKAFRAQNQRRLAQEAARARRNPGPIVGLYNQLTGRE